MKTGILKRCVCFILCLLFFAPAVAARAESAQALYPARFGNLYGYVDEKGETVLEPQWGYCDEFRGDYAVVGLPSDNPENSDADDALDRLDGVIDRTGAYVVEPEYFSDTGYDGMLYGGELGVVWLWNQEKEGFFDIASGYFSGMVYTREVNPWVGDERLIPLCQNDLYGFIDRTNGEIVIPCQYEDEPESFANGFAYVPLSDGDEGFMLVDERNRPYAPPAGTALEGRGFDCGRVEVRDEATGLFGYADTEGALAIPAVFEQTTAFCEGYAAVRKDGLWGHVAVDGSWACRPRFAADAYPRGYTFHSGVALLYGADGSTTAIDAEGNELFTLENADVSAFGEGEATLFTRHNEEGFGGTYPVGAVNRAGEVLFAPSDGYLFEDSFATGYLDYFAEGLQVLVRNNLYGFADEKGNEAIPFVWSDAVNFRDGLAWVRDADGKWAYIDHTGAAVWREP